MRRLNLTTVLCVLLVAGCYQEPIAVTTLAPTPVPRVTILPTAESSQLASVTQSPPTASPVGTPTSTTPPTSPPTPDPIAGGSPSAGCVNGWTGPPAGAVAYEEGIAILGGAMGRVGPWAVAEMRYFTGPDSPGVIEPRFETVERWYIKGSPTDDAAFRGRWLLEKRTDQILGVSGVAPWESFDYKSPDWTGFIGEGAAQTYIGLSGQWSGIPFDFVTGEGDGGQPGLPREVVDCLAGT